MQHLIKNGQNFDKMANLLKMTWEIYEIFTRTLESPKIGTLMGSFYPKYKMYELKIYRGVLCYDNEEWCKIWRGIDLSVQNWHPEFDECWPEHSKIPKICTLIGCFWSKYIMLELKKYRGVIFDGIEDWCNIWRKTDSCFLKIFVYRLKNTDFIFESKMVELNWKQNFLIHFESYQDVPYSHE